MAVDLRDADAAQKVVDAAISAFGGIDVLVNNAGATKRGDFFALSDDDWQDGFALKVHGSLINPDVVQNLLEGSVEEARKMASRGIMPKAPLDPPN